MKRIILCSLLSLSVGIFGASEGEEALELPEISNVSNVLGLTKALNGLFYLQIAGGIGNNGIGNRDDQNRYANGKYLVSSTALSVVVSLVRPVVKRVGNDTPVNLGRYQPTSRQVALFIYDVFSEEITDEGAKALVRNTSSLLISEKVKRKYACRPKKIITQIAEKSVHEGFYQLVCAEVHKRESLKCAHDWFPTGTDDTKTEEMSLQGIGYAIKYGIAKKIVSGVSGAAVGAVKLVASACGW